MIKDCALQCTSTTQFICSLSLSFSRNPALCNPTARFTNRNPPQIFFPFQFLLVLYALFFQPRLVFAMRSQWPQSLVSTIQSNFLWSVDEDSEMRSFFPRMRLLVHEVRDCCFHSRMAELGRIVSSRDNGRRVAKFICFTLKNPS